MDVGELVLLFRDELVRWTLYGCRQTGRRVLRRVRCRDDVRSRVRRHRGSVFLVGIFALEGGMVRVVRVERIMSWVSVVLMLLVVAGMVAIMVELLMAWRSGPHSDVVRRRRPRVTVGVALDRHVCVYAATGMRGESRESALRMLFGGPVCCPCVW